MKRLKNFTTLFLVFGFVLFLNGCDDANETEQTNEETPIVEIEEEDLDNEYEENELEADNVEDLAPESINSFVELLVFELGRDVEGALAEFGNPTSDMTMDLLGTESRTVSWWTTGGWRTLATSMTVTFTDGIATSVMETADSSSVFSWEDAESIESGISESEAYAILGAPYSITHMYMEFFGYSTTVNWIDADFNSIMIMFTDGYATSVTRLNL